MVTLEMVTLEIASDMTTSFIDDSDQQVQAPAGDRQHASTQIKHKFKTSATA